MLICVQGAWRFLRLKIGYEWFRLFLLHYDTHRKTYRRGTSPPERSVTWFANKLYCDRTNTYKIFKRQSIDTELLLRISQVLHVNFFEYYSRECQNREKQSTLM